MFAKIKAIKGSYIVDTLYGKYVKAIFNPPIISIFTNEKFEDYITSLSADHWLRLNINFNYTIEYRITNWDENLTSVNLKNLNIKK